MNAKKAKLLRQAAAYKNQSKTPGVMDFPGIARVAKMPLFEKHMAIKTSYERLPLDDKFTKVHTEVQRLTLRNNNPVPVLHAGGHDEAGVALAGTPRYELLPLSKPGKLRPLESKGTYRAMKKLIRRFGFYDGLATYMAEGAGVQA